MCKELFFWFTEFLNYWSLAFWGLKLLLEWYESQFDNKFNCLNLKIAIVSIPISLLSVGNYKVVVYSNPVTYVFSICLYITIKVFTKSKSRKSFSLAAIYVNCMRLIDLWIVAVIHEVCRVSRYIYIDLIHMGISRSIFMIILSISYYVLYKMINKSVFLDYLYDNRFYRWTMCIYSFLGIICFYRVYRFDYTEQLIQYWIFYLVCAFVLIGGFLLYLIRGKVQERERILNMRNDMMEANYQGLQKAYDINRTLQHDYKNHLLAVYELIKEDKNNEALNYINTYMDFTKESLKNIKSGNNILNIIVSSKVSEAEEKEIHFNYEVGYLGDILIEDIDICVLIANLLDNAIEACERIVDDTRWIKLKIIRRNDMLFLLISNSIHEDVLKKKNIFQSEKNNPQIHGWGMKSIERVVDKYGGSKEYSLENRQIQMLINIPLENN